MAQQKNYKLSALYFKYLPYDPITLTQRGRMKSLMLAILLYMKHKRIAWSIFGKTAYVCYMAILVDTKLPFDLNAKKDVNVTEDHPRAWRVGHWRVCVLPRVLHLCFQGNDIFYLLLSLLDEQKYKEALIYFFVHLIVSSIYLLYFY